MKTKIDPFANNRGNFKTNILNVNPETNSQLRCSFSDFEGSFNKEIFLSGVREYFNWRLEQETYYPSGDNFNLMRIQAKRLGLRDWLQDEYGI